VTQLAELPAAPATVARNESPADAEATAISRATAVITAVLVVVAGVCAAVDVLQISGLALFAASATSIASVAGRPSRGYRWVGPLVIGVAMLTVIIAGFVDH